MNIINIEKENVRLNIKKREVKCEYYIGQEIFDISKIEIEILKDNNLKLNINEEEFKADITFNVKDNVTVNVDIFEDIKKGKIKFNYNLGLNSKIIINKINDSKIIREYTVVNLNNKNSLFDYNFKSIGKQTEVYDFLINHNAKETESNIKNNIVNISANITLQVTTSIKKGNSKSVANQINKIINLNNKKCEIKPNLLIDEFDSIANHSAYIGDFNKDELFYLMSRGLDKKTCENLLIKGILTSDIKDNETILKINDIISKYWG